MKVTFLVSSPTVQTSTKKTIKGVVGGQERVDVISRCLLNLFYWKKRFAFELSLIMYLAHQDEKKAFFINLLDLDYVIASELDSTDAIIKILSNPSSLGVEMKKILFENLIKELAKKYDIYYLTPQGMDVGSLSKTINIKRDLMFVLGSQYDLTERQEQSLFDLNAHQLSLGKENYLASHVITIVCHKLSLLSL
ncbi:MAG: hypothetical protein ACTSSG_05790 [Candidatus Heimdallarchaeaceae archaeon]